MKKKELRESGQEDADKKAREVENNTEGIGLAQAHKFPAASMLDLSIGCYRNPNFSIALILSFYIITCVF